MAIFLGAVTHDLISNTLEATWFEKVTDAGGIVVELKRLKVRNYNQYQKAEFDADTGTTVYSELAGWLYSDSEYIPPAVQIPSVVSMRQARLALLQAGLLSTVNAAVAAGGDADQITWEYATEVDRNSPLVANMKAGLNLTDADLDNLFLLAASL